MKSSKIYKVKRSELPVNPYNSLYYNKLTNITVGSPFQNSPLNLSLMHFNGSWEKTNYLEEEAVVRWNGPWAWGSVEASRRPGWQPRRTTLGLEVSRNLHELLAACSPASTLRRPRTCTGHPTQPYLLLELKYCENLWIFIIT